MAGDRPPTRVLTDTHSLVWALSDPASLSPVAGRVLANSEVTASVANLWELCLKAQRRRIAYRPIPWWNKYIVNPGIPALPIRATHVMGLEHWPTFTEYPFDRILVAQSIVEKLPLVTKDAHLAKYGIQTVW